MPDEPKDKPASDTPAPGDAPKSATPEADAKTSASTGAAADAKRADESAAKPASTRPPPTAKPADEPAAKPADEPAAKPADEPAAKPADEPAAKPANEAAAKPADEPAAAGAKGAVAGDEAPKAAPPPGAALEAPSTPDEDPDAAPDAPVFPRPSAFVPAKIKKRDLALTLVPAALLASVMLFRGDVVNPRGDDPAHRLGHFASLIRSGHVPGGVLIGLVLVLLITVGILGILGDSPLDLRGDEVKPVASDDAARPWWRREGSWLVGFCVLLYIPLAGAYGLWDPWETHYGEVAREILARDDWITLWWGQEGWFMSKPILIFWLAALGMGVGSTFGLSFWRDSGPGHHEWCIRLPIIFLCIAAVYAVYRAVRGAWGRRAGLLCGLVLATMPHWFFLSHQAMTDMPFVAPLVIAMSFLMMAVTADPERDVAARPVTLFGRTFRVSMWHLVVGAILMVAVPQVLYLLTRPVMVACPEDADRSCQAVLEASRVGPLQFPIERYWSGSAGNSAYKDLAASIPGSPAWEDRYNQIPFAPSFVQGIVWLALGALLMLSFRRERRVQGLAFAMVYLFGAISFMGKGPAGLGVPEIVLLGFMITSGKWKLLPRIRLFQGIGIFLLCGFPWYIAIYCRLGNEFFDRFVVHDLLNRAFAGVHGDTGTFRYFVWQLGYAMFPWVGLVPAALVGWRLYVPQSASEAQKDVVRLALLWFLVTFTLFSVMVTKFHHYIFPAVPGAAVLTGLLLHRMLGDRRLAHSREGLVAVGALVAGVAMMVFGVTNFFGAWHGAVSRTAPYQLPPGNTALGVVLTVAGVAAVVWSFFAARRAEVTLGEGALVVVGRRTSKREGGYRAVPGEASADVVGEAPVEPVPTSTMARHASAALGAVGLGATVLLAIIARDIGWVGQSRPAGYERFIHLFIYNYERPFPTRSFDYHAILSGFGIVAVVIAAGITVAHTRRHAARALVALAAVFGFWALDKYMIDLSNHWSQRNLFERYYAVRRDRETTGYGEDARYWADPIAAYQMNWKGENFYTGNHAAMLECGLPLCRERTNEWLRRHAGQRLFFVTEHSRSGSVISQVQSQGGTARTITDEYDNNKFVLVEANLR